MIEWLKKIFGWFKAEEMQIAGALHALPLSNAAHPTYRQARLTQSLKYFNDLREAVEDSGVTTPEFEAQLVAIEEWVKTHIDLAQQEGSQ